MAGEQERTGSSGLPAIWKEKCCRNPSGCQQVSPDLVGTLGATVAFWGGHWVLYRGIIIQHRPARQRDNKPKKYQYALSKTPNPIAWWQMQRTSPCPEGFRWGEGGRECNFKVAEFSIRR